MEVQNTIKAFILTTACFLSVACQQATTVSVSINDSDVVETAQSELHRFARIIDPDNSVIIQQQDNSVRLQFTGLLTKQSQALIKSSLNRLAGLKRSFNNISFTLTVTEEELPKDFIKRYGDQRRFILKPLVPNKGEIGLKSYESGGGSSKLYCLYETPLQELGPAIYYRKVLQAHPENSKQLGSLGKLINISNELSPGKALKHKVIAGENTYSDLTPLVRVIRQDLLILSFIEESESVFDDPVPQVQPGEGLTTALQYPDNGQSPAEACSEKLLNSSDSFYQAFLFPELAGKVVSYKVGDEYIW